MHDSGYWHAKAIEAMKDSKEDEPKQDYGFGNYPDITPTELLHCELEKDKDDICIERVETFVKRGADLDFRNRKGYTFSERAGLKGRLDVVARINELRSGWK